VLIIKESILKEKIMFDNFVYNIYRGLYLKINSDKKLNFKSSTGKYKSLEYYYIIIKKLYDQETKKFISYSVIDPEQKATIIEASYALNYACGESIHRRFLELGFDNYNNSLNSFTIESFGIKLKELGHLDLYKKLSELKTSKEKLKSRKYAKKPIQLSFEMLSTVFRTDKIIQFECNVLMYSIYSILTKKARNELFKFSSARTPYELNDLINTGMFGFLESVIFWNHNSYSFSSFGWVFAKRRIYKLIQNSRIIRFPSHVEDLITRLNLKINDDVKILKKQPISEYAIEKKVLNQNLNEIQKVHNLFASLGSNTNKTYTTNFPKEQIFVCLDKKLNEFNNRKSIYDVLIVSNQQHISEYLLDLNVNIKLIFESINLRERIILKLKYGFKVTLKEFEEFGKDKYFYHNIYLAKYYFPLTNDRIGSLIDLSKERVRQLLTIVYNKIKAFSFADDLKSLIN
jgi:RNA polymerase sigma factor (sigma-70 family)